MALPANLRTDFTDGTGNRHLASHHNLENAKVNTLIAHVRNDVQPVGTATVTASTYNGDPVDMSGKSHVDVTLNANLTELDLDMSNCEYATIRVLRNATTTHLFGMVDVGWVPGGIAPIIDPTANSATILGVWCPDGTTKFGVHQQPIYYVPFGVTGGVDLTTMTNVIPDYPLLVPHRIVSYVFRLKTATATQALILDVNFNGTTVFTTQANRPTFAVGQTRSTLTMPNTTLLVPTGGTEGLLGLDIDQVGGAGGRGRGLSGVVKMIALS